MPCFVPSSPATLEAAQRGTLALHTARKIEKDEDELRKAWRSDRINLANNDGSKV